MPGYKREFIFSGEDIFLYDFPERTRMVYAPDTIPPIQDENSAIIQSLDSPLGTPPLISQVSPNSRVTIAFDDPSIPIPPITRDIRGKVIEAVVEKLYAAGVKKENIRLICAVGLHRKWTMKELSIILGKKIIKEFSDSIICHDAEDNEEIVSLGKTTMGEDVEVNRALVESDIVIYVNLNFVTMNGGWKSTTVGLGTYNSIRHHHRPNPLKIGSLIDPETSAMHSSISRMGELVNKQCNIFAIETVVNNDIWSGILKKYLTPVGLNKKRKPSLIVRGSVPISAAMPNMIKRRFRESIRAGYRLIGINAGKVDLVHERTLELLFQQQNISVKGQSDIVIYGVPNFCPYSTFSTINPILVITMAMGYYFNLHRHRPLVKKNGIVIITNPLIEQFNKQHHPSYYDFYTKYLSEFTNPQDIPEDLEESYARDQKFINLYRNHYAFHGVHSILAWYWASKGLNHADRVIVAGVKDPMVAKKMGLTSAKDLTEAIQIAEEIMGKDASISYHYLIPMSAVDVK